jgi:hypothetical protein
LSGPDLAFSDDLPVGDGMSPKKDRRMPGRIAAGLVWLPGLVAAGAVLGLLAMPMVGSRSSLPEARAQAVPRDRWEPGGGWPALPEPVSNQATAVAVVDGQPQVVSLLGIGPGKSYRDIRRSAYLLEHAARPGRRRWRRLPDVPGPVGRLASAAVGVGERVFLFGGYTVDAQGEEVSLPNLDILELRGRRWRRGRDIPVPVDDAVLGIYQDRYVYVVSGWSQKDSVRDVQIYDTASDTWAAATPIPGQPVFGHAGALAGRTLVYVDGAFLDHQRAAGAPKYRASDQCWRGVIDAADRRRITWTRLPPHPGQARYRTAAAALGDRRVVFVGGTDNPYNYAGLGYDKRPSQPAGQAFAWDLAGERWETLPGPPRATMDHRAMVALGPGGPLLLIGGMDASRRVIGDVQALLAR